MGSVLAPSSLPGAAPTLGIPWLPEASRQSLPPLPRGVSQGVRLCAPTGLVQGRQSYSMGPHLTSLILSAMTLFPHKATLSATRA